jgi:hypothetical protein
MPAKDYQKYTVFSSAAPIIHGCADPSLLLHESPSKEEKTATKIGDVFFIEQPGTYPQQREQFRPILGG